MVPVFCLNGDGDKRWPAFYRLTALGILGAGLAALAVNIQPSGAPAATGPGETLVPEDQDLPLLGELIGRRYHVRVHASPEGPLYTVCTPEGEVLEAELHADEVYEFFPDLDIKNLHFGPDRERRPSRPDALMFAPPPGDL